MSQHQRGVTLVELMTVVACLGILAAIAVPNWVRSGWPVYRLKNAAHQVVADVRYARTRAVAVNRGYRLHVDAISDTYVVETENPAGGSPAWIEAGSVRQFGDAAGASFRGVGIAGGGEYSIVFHPTGSVTPATVTLENSLGHTMKVVCSMAGRIRVVRE